MQSNLSQSTYDAARRHELVGRPETAITRKGKRGIMEARNKSQTVKAWLSLATRILIAIAEVIKELRK